MPLQGTFDVLDFGEVLLLLGSKRLSGRLHARSGGAAANLYFDDGYLTAADASAKLCFRLGWMTFVGGKMAYSSTGPARATR